MAGPASPPPSPGVPGPRLSSILPLVLSLPSAALDPAQLQGRRCVWGMGHSTLPLQLGSPHAGAGRGSKSGSCPGRGWSLWCWCCSVKESCPSWCAPCLLPWARAQGLLRFAWLSVPALVVATRLLRWWGKVGMSSGSQAVGQREGSAGPREPQSSPVGGLLTQGLLLEVGALQAVFRCRPVGMRGHRRHPPEGTDLPPALGTALSRGQCDAGSPIRRQVSSSPARPRSCPRRAAEGSYRFLGSYMKRKLSSRKPASDSQGNLCLRLL